jgi:DNA-binding XRE family transcriptional regulator
MHKLKEYRERAGLSQCRIAKLSGIAGTTYRAYEVENQMPSLAIARRIVKSLNAAKVKCKLDDVFPPEKPS